jgi:Gly-Xaa carboxypeptidase
VDEGFTGVDIEYDTSFARVGVAEKGCLTITLSVLTEGGHSSRPPKHTGVGIMSRLLVELENHPSAPRLAAGNPLLSYLECAAEHGNMDDRLRGMVRREECWPLLAEEVGQDRILSTFLKTTQAVDVVNGGIKFNALPEVSTSLLGRGPPRVLISQSVNSMTNYRIDFFETTQDTIDKLIGLLKPLAESFNMSFGAFDELPGVDNNIIRLNTFGLKLEPAPVTPSEGPAWELMGGTIKHLFPETIVVPSAMTALTDTQRQCSRSPVWIID